MADVKRASFNVNNFCYISDMERKIFYQLVIKAAKQPKNTISLKEKKYIY